MLLHIMIPTSNGSTYSIIDGKLGTYVVAILGTMRHEIELIHSCLLVNYTVTMCAMVPVMCPPWGLMGILDTSIGLLPPWNPHRFVAVG